MVVSGLCFIEDEDGQISKQKKMEKKSSNQ